MMDRWVGKGREGENELTRGITISALSCLLVVGAAAASILGRSSVPDAGPQAAASIAEKVVSNRESKADKLAVVRLALASLEPQQPPAAPAASTAPLQSAEPSNSAERSTEPLQQAYASAAPTDTIDAPHEVTAPAESSPKPKLVEKPAPPKPYSLLSDAQIASIKERLKLSPDQESYWPSVETALRAVAQRIQANRQASRHPDPHANSMPIDPDAPEVQQLKSAAMPLLFGLREDQKREVRSLARLIGLEKVAEMI
jgi:hypothetical protein